MRELDQFKAKYLEIQALNSSLHDEIQTYSQRVNDYETRIVELRTMSRPQPPTPTNRAREEQLEKELQSLRREVDEANFRGEQLVK